MNTSLISVFAMGIAGLAPNWIKFAQNRTNLGLFKISFSTFWLRFVPFRPNLKQIVVGKSRHPCYTCIVTWICLVQGFQIWHPNWVRLAPNRTNLSQNVLKLILKSPRFVPFFGGPIWPNLDAKFDIPGHNLTGHVCQSQAQSRSGRNQ